MKRLWQIVVSLSVIVTLCATSFLLPVKAADATLNDLYNLLNSIDQALSAPSSNRSTDLIYRFTQLKQDFEWLFGKYGDGQGDGHINYMLNNQSVAGSTMSIAMGDLISQQNDILMTLASSYVDASDPDNVVVKPGVLSQLTNILNGINSNSITDSSILTTVNSMLSDTTSMKNTINNIYQLLFDRIGFDIPVYSWSLFDGILRSKSLSYINVDKYGCFIKGSDIVNQKWRFNTRSNSPVYILYAVSQYNAVISNLIDESNNGSISLLRTLNSNSLYFKLYKIEASGWFTVEMPYNTSSTSNRIYPIYFGPTENLPNELEYLLGPYFSNVQSELLKAILNDLQDSSDNVSWLQKIYNHIVGDPDNSNKTQQYIDSMNDKVSDIQDSLDNYSGQLDQNIDNVNPSSLLRKVEEQGNKVNFLSGIMQRVYLSFGDYAWIFLVPLVMALILLFMG